MNSNGRLMYTKNAPELPLFSRKNHTLDNPLYAMLNRLNGVTQHKIA